MCNEVELKIIDRGYVSIGKITDKFLVEDKEIETRDGPKTADYYIPNQKDAPSYFLYSFDHTSKIIKG